jgi:hypothetical protein
MRGADARKIDAVLAQPGQGAALYTSPDGATTLTVSFGNRHADIGSRFPPASYGEFALRGFCPPVGRLLADEGISPALRNREKIPQIPTRLWAAGGSKTVHPGQRTGLDSILPVFGARAGADPGHRDRGLPGTGTSSATAGGEASEGGPQVLVVAVEVI